MVDGIDIRHIKSRICRCRCWRKSRGIGSSRFQRQEFAVVADQGDSVVRDVLAQCQVLRISDQAGERFQIHQPGYRGMLWCYARALSEAGSEQVASVWAVDAAGSIVVAIGNGPSG